MSSAAATLPTLEVAIRCAGATFARRQDIGVHTEAHTTAGLSPFEAGRFENTVETFLFGLALNCLGTRNHHRANGVSNPVPADNRGGSTEIFDTGVGAGT